MGWESPVPTINRLGHIETDASRQGWGAYCQGMSTGGRWLPEETSYHINCLELLAGSLAIMSFTNNKAKAQVLLLMNNISAVTYINLNGRDTLPHAILPSQKSMGLVPHPKYVGDSALHPRNTECKRGQGIESISRFQRLETSSRGFQPPPSEVGSSEYRPLCLPSLLLTRSVCKLASRPSSNSHGCIHPGLGDLSGLCISSICPDRPMPSPNSEPAGVTHGVCSTSLASSTLVSTTITPVHRLPSPPTSSGRSTHPGKQNPPTQTPKLAGWLLSAEVTKRQTFLCRVEKSSWQPGGKIQLVPIPLPGQNGVAGVVNMSMLIPFHHL